MGKLKLTLWEIAWEWNKPESHSIMASERSQIMSHYKWSVSIDPSIAAWKGSESRNLIVTTNRCVLSCVDIHWTLIASSPVYQSISISLVYMASLSIVCYGKMAPLQKCEFGRSRLQSASSQPPLSGDDCVLEVILCPQVTRAQHQNGKHCCIETCKQLVAATAVPAVSLSTHRICTTSNSPPTVTRKTSIEESLHRKNGIPPSYHRLRQQYRRLDAAQRASTAYDKERQVGFSPLHHHHHLETVNDIELFASRCLTVTPSLQESEGWLSKLLMVRKIDTGKESHSRLLSDTEKVFELYSKHIFKLQSANELTDCFFSSRCQAQTQPGLSGELVSFAIMVKWWQMIYNDWLFSKNWSTELQSKDDKAKLIGSWKVEVGDQDQYGLFNDNNSFYELNLMISFYSSHLELWWLEARFSGP